MTVDPPRYSVRGRFVAIAVGLALAVAGATQIVAQSKRDFSVSSHKYAFKVDTSDKLEIRVTQGDTVHITFSTDDIPHSFTIEEYRIMKRADPGKPVTFDFLADRVSPPEGFPIKCTLTIDGRCKELHAVLIVEKKKSTTR